MQENGLFIKKKQSFTMVANSALWDTSLTNKACGLYARIQSYIMIPDFKLYKSFLMNRCPEGERAFQSAWDELKEKGYLKQYRIRDKETNRFVYQYELLETADTSTPTTINVGIDNEKKTEIKENTTIESTLEDNVSNEIHNGVQVEHQLKSEEIKLEKEIVKSNIEYDILVEANPTDKELIDNLVDIMTDVITSTAPTEKVNGSDMPRNIIKEQFKNLDDTDIEYILFCYKKNKKDIKNIRAYFITVLYNAKKTKDAFYKNLVNSSSG